jgi:protein involved in polysaccharide export with SLBB domain
MMKKVLLSFFILFNISIIPQALNPGDGVRVIFYNIPENISGDYHIQMDGRVQMPFIGLITTRDRDFTEIREEITHKYDSLYRNPELTIQPLLRINILGEVRQPGFYYLTGVEKLSGLMAMAGGETSDADISNIYIIRNDQELALDSEELLAGGGTVGDIGLQSGDRIFVPRQWWVGARNAAVIVSGVAVLVTLVSLFVR